MPFYYLTLRSIIPYMTALLFVIHALLQPLPPDITTLFDPTKSITSVAVATPAVAGMESPPFWFKQKLIESRYQKKQLAKEQRIQRIEQECATRGMKRINRRIEERMLQFVTKEDVEQSKSWAEAMRAEFEAYLAKEKAAEKKARSTFFGSLASVVKDIVAGKQHGQVEEEEAEDGVEENGIEDLHCRIRQERELQLQKQQHRPISPSPSIAERILSPEYVGYREFFNYIKLRHAELIAEIARSARVLDQLMPESMEDCIYNCNE
ncbi:hypothetical protein GQ42DRAFT_179955 [Ramicandelaber brevisporus]|nr:hypothetical protein GQ42DRAFT_179955 [Ramicandelaber brevisporus]